jgi:hypothetical protein
MKVYIIASKINGGDCFLKEEIKDNCVSQITLKGAGKKYFNADLFYTKQHAEEALDKLTHGLAKHCRILEVNICEPKQDYEENFLPIKTYGSK